MHKELIAVIEEAILEGKIKNISRAAPRGYAKSTLISLILPLWCIIYGYKRYILIVSDTAGQANDFLSGIRDELDNNELLISDYGMFKGVVWTNSDIITMTDVRVQALGVGKKVRGRRYKQYRPDLIVGDDLENDEQIRSVEQRKKAKIWYNKALSKAGARNTLFIVIGTILHNDSLLAYLLNNPVYDSKIYKAILSWSNSELWLEWEKIITNLANVNRLIDAREYYEQNKADMLDGTRVLWEERESYYDLMVERIAQGPSAFLSEKQNEPVNDDDRRFEPDWIEYYEDSDIKDLVLYKVEYIDPSLGKSGGDFSAIVTIGYDSNTGYIYVLEADIRKRHPDLIVSDAISWHRIFHLDMIGVEEVSFQEFFKDEFVKAIDKAVKANEVEPVIVKGVHSHSDKILRIQSLQPDIKSGRIKFKRNQQELVRQLLDFPSADHDDGPDALHGAVEMLGKNTALREFYSKKAYESQQNTTRPLIQNSYLSRFGN